MKNNKSIVEKLTYPYRIVVHDEINFAEKFSFHLTWARIVVYSFLFFVLSAGITGAILNFVGKEKKSIDVSRNDYEMLLETIEDLESEIALRDKFLADFQKSLRGEALSSQNTKDSAFRPVQPNEKELNNLDSSEIQLRKQFESQNSEQNVSLTENNIHLFPPIQGVVSRGFIGKEKHYGIDIVCKKNEPIKTVADGSVIMSSWTREAGYVLGIQHNNQMISFYKHCSVLHKQAGDLVKAGDIIAIVGNSGEYTDGPHLHFELWYKGTAIDPNNFISF